MDQPNSRDAGAVSAGIGPAIRGALGRSVGTRPRRWLLAVTVLIGVTVAVGLAVGAEPSDRTFEGVAGPVQMLMSVTLPFFGVLVGRDLRRAGERAQITPTLLAATLVALAVGAVGALACAAALAVAPSGGPARWEHAATIVVGGVLVQVVAQLVGTGMGLLIRPIVVACLATIVLPLGLWLLLGSADVMRPARDWLTPYAAAQHLLSGEMSALAWVRWFVVFLLWGPGLNAFGARRGGKRERGRLGGS